ncbi:trypsin-2-like [Bradysia coprophila]|uniref:trypsin-2-like n=1 Tax=Bradysia coprophila TaxID=38358 RepID=UPI00187D79D6|nr:trypsin-2-like [Bradysia coprophila]
MTFRSFYFLCLLLVTVNLCRGDGENSADKSASTRIVGGTLAYAGEYPAQISLQKRNRFPFCGGTLIDASHVLTAAHCCTTQTGVVNGPSTYFLMGNSLTVPPQISLSNQTRDATHVFVHPYYNSNTMANDVAVIRVSPPFTFNTTIRSATRTPSRPPSNSNCSVAGWGTTSTDGAASSSLRRVNVLTIDHTRCNRAYGNIHPTGMICAGTVEGGKDSCQGDSGGGLYCGNYVVGIVSFGATCGDARFPGVYTSIAAYNDWIDSTLVWSGGSHYDIPTPRPGGASTIFVSLYVIAFGVYIMLVLR